MSIEMMTAVWGLELPRPHQIVLLALADHADDDGICWPSIARLAWKTGYSARQVQRIITEAVGTGIVEVVGREVGGRGRSNRYRLRLENGVKKSPFVSETVTSPHTKGDTKREKGDTAMSDESSLEPPTEPPTKPPGDDAPAVNASTIIRDVFRPGELTGVMAPRWAAEIKRALKAGDDPDIVRQAVRIVFNRRGIPSSVHYVIADITAGKVARVGQSSVNDGWANVEERIG